MTGGTIFKLNAATGALTTLVEFTANGASNRGAVPVGALVADGAGFFWGTTNQGGATGNGTVFKINAATGALTTLVEFTNNAATNKGRYPAAALVSDGSGFFWGDDGVRRDAGPRDDFQSERDDRCAHDGAPFHAKRRGQQRGASLGTLLNDGSGSFWGTTQGGGAALFGTVFKVGIASGALTTVFEFSGYGAQAKNGSQPSSGLFKHSDGKFYGTTFDGGPENGGTIYRILPESILESWRATHFGAATLKTRDLEDFDGDGVANAVEFACATNPASAGSGVGALRYTGTFLGNGTLAGTGQPISKIETTGNASDVRALFVRRKDRVTAGLTYTPQFSETLGAGTWQDSATVPTVLTDDGVNEVVSVPFPPQPFGHRQFFFRLRLALSPP